MTDKSILILPVKPYACGECPLVEIKTPHGRLIDEDALIDDLIEQKIPFNARVNESIIITPTILEAEE